MPTKTIADLFKQERAAWLESARSEAKKQLRNRRYITIEDVLIAKPRPQYVHRNTTGHVFQDPDFIWVGVTKSLRPVSNGRLISKWALRKGNYAKKT